MISMNRTMGPPNMPNINVHIELVLKLNYDVLSIMIPLQFHEEGFAYVLALCFMATTNVKTSLKRS